MADLADKLEVRIFTRLFEQVGICVRHYDVVGKAGNGVSLAQIAAALSTKFHTAFKNVMPQAAEFRGVGVRRISPLPLTLEALDGSQSGLGVQAGEPLPGQVSGIITHMTLFAGKRFRGRSYIAFPSEDENTATGLPMTAYVTRLNAIATLLDDTVVVTSGADSNTILPVVRSKKFGLWTAITNSFARARWATQRRRGNYGAPNISPI